MHLAGKWYNPKLIEMKIRHVNYIVTLFEYELL